MGHEYGYLGGTILTLYTETVLEGESERERVRLLGAISIFSLH